MSDKSREQDKWQQRKSNEEQGQSLLTNGQTARRSSTESESSIPYMDRLNDASSSSSISVAPTTTSGNASKEQLLEDIDGQGPSNAEKRNVHLTIVVQVDEKDNHFEAKCTELSRLQSGDGFVGGGDESCTESPEILATAEPMSRSLRRNSISLPMGIDAVDLEALRLKYQMQEQEALSEEEKSDSHGESINDDSCGSVTLTVPERSSSSINQKDEDESDDEEYSSSRRKYR
ncbi:uncharacterized protein LOC118732731 [Rhagoletis pomonella]|uniref:uncharacterized protein LOC118732731 n=1 Tax=Rhagoletis pomonella TaxID=28610 RepID=UPI0017859C8C|nr:uncharacterized protein LOC118732731 [Rhagoletis pomonella]